MDPNQPARVGLRCVRGAGLGIADARGLRIDVRDGGLRVHRPDREAEIVGTVGTLTSAVWLDADQTRKLLEPRNPLMMASSAIFGPMTRWRMRRSLGSVVDRLDELHGGSVVMSGPDGVALSFRIDTFAAWSGDPAQKREESGAVGLVRSLGLALESADPAALPSRHEVRRALVEPQPQARYVRPRALGLALLAGALAFLSLPYGDTWIGWWFRVAALAAVAPVLVQLVAHRRQFLRLVTSPPEIEGAVLYRPPSAAIGQLEAHLQFSERDVVLVDSGRETWLPGPAAGGVVACVMGETDTAWLDRKGFPQLVLRTDQVAPDEPSRGRLMGACRVANIDARHDVIASYGGTSIDLLHQFGDPDVGMSEWEKGYIGIVVDAVLIVGWLCHMMSSLFYGGYFGLWGYPVVAGSLAWIGVRAWSGIEFRRWRADIRRRARAVPQEAT